MGGVHGRCCECSHRQVQARVHHGRRLARGVTRRGSQRIETCSSGDAAQGDSCGDSRVGTVRSAKEIGGRRRAARRWNTTFTARLSRRSAARSAGRSNCSPALVSGRVPRCGCVICIKEATLDGAQACQKKALKAKKNFSARDIKVESASLREVGLFSQSVWAPPQDGPRPRRKHDDIVQLFGERLVP